MIRKKYDIQVTIISHTTGAMAGHHCWFYTVLLVVWRPCVLSQLFSYKLSKAKHSKETILSHFKKADGCGRVSISDFKRLEYLSFALNALRTERADRKESYVFAISGNWNRRKHWVKLLLWIMNSPFRASDMPIMIRLLECGENLAQTTNIYMW